jgi:hypothetical protein
MKPWQRVLAALLLFVLFLALARAFSFVNEYFGSETGITELHMVLSKGTRYVPIPVATLRLQSPCGELRSIEVPDSKSSSVKVGTEVEVVRSRGAIGRDWFQDKEFYEELKGGRRIQGIPYAAVLLMFAFFIYKQMQVVGASRRTAAFCLPAVVGLAYALFYSGVAA